MNNDLKTREAELLAELNALRSQRKRKTREKFTREQVQERRAVVQARYDIAKAESDKLTAQLRKVNAEKMKQYKLLFNIDHYYDIDARN